MIKTGAGICSYKYEVEKINRFYLFIYIFVSISTRWKYSPVHIHQKVFNDLYYIHKVERFERETRTCE